MKKFGELGIVYISVLALGISGCASIMSGTTQEVTFQSNPDGALVTVNGREMGKTPMTTSIKRGSSKPLLFSKDGYKPVSMELASELNPWFWGDIVCLGLYGSTTDGLSGAAHKYAPSQYMVTLTPIGALPMESQTALSDRQKAKEFIVIGYKDIIGDLQKGEGQYLASLIDVLKIPADGKEEAIKKIRGLSEAYNSIPEFADRVIEIYIK